MSKKKMHLSILLSVFLAIFISSNALAATTVAVPTALSGGDYSENYLEDVKYDDAGGNPSYLKTNGDGWYDVNKLDQMYLDSFDISGISGDITAVTLEIQYSVQSGYSGPEAIKWTLDGGTLSSTGVIPADGESNVTRTFDLFAQGVDTAQEISTLDIAFKNDDTKGPDAVAFDYVNIIVETSEVGDTTPPAAPSDVVVTDAATGGRLDISWTNPSDTDFDHIHIYRSTDVGILGGLVYDNIVGTTQSDIGLINGITYYYTLRSVDTSNNESTNINQYSGVPSGGDTTAPAPPTNISVNDSGLGGELNLAWINPSDTDFDHIHVYRSSSAGVLGLLVYDNVSGTSISDTGLTNGITYYYTLRSVDTSSNESANTDQYSGIPSDTVAPAQVTGLAVTDPAVGGELDLTWDNNSESDLTGYRIYRSTTGGQTGSLINSVSGTSYTDTGLTDGTAYYYQLSAYDTALNEGPLSIQESGIPTTSVSGGFNIKGIEYVSWWYDEYTYTASDESLDDLASTNANNVGLIVTWYMDTGISTTLYSDVLKTPIDDAVIHAINDIHSRGMEVMLKPHIDSKDGTWRGQIAPSDINAWFASYTSFIEHYAQIAKDYGVEYLCVGTELKSLSGSTYTSNWNSTIDAIESIYTSPLTYAANWDEYTNVSFWDRMDYGGVDAYFPLSELQNPSVEELKAGWTNYSGTYGTHNWIAELEAWQASINKPIIFTEIGYRSIDYAAKEPWAWGNNATYNAQLQANCYQATIEVLQEKSWFAGMYWWDWLAYPTAGGDGDIDFTPQNKPAEATLTALYGGEVNSAPNKPSLPSGPTVGASTVSYTYSTSTTDPDGDAVSYLFDWGDGTTTTTEFVASGVTVNASHAWSNKDFYDITVKAIDDKGNDSVYSDALSVRIGNPPKALEEDGIYEDLSQTRLYPNPSRSTSIPITIDRLSADVDLQIYNIAGELVYEQNKITGGSVEWNKINTNGDSIASGIYIYLLKDSNGDKKTGKLGVIK
ncbi:MAG: T9SS type A sorting domain-containing protein [bacterium]